MHIAKRVGVLAVLLVALLLIVALAVFATSYVVVALLTNSLPF